MDVLNRLGIVPGDEKLYIKAFTHTSYSNEHYPFQKIYFQEKEKIS